MARRTVRTFMNKWSRKLHRWGAVLTALPVVIILVTGLLLQVKKEFSWIQPSTAKGTTTTPDISFDTILQAAISVTELNVQSWDDIDRLDVRPGKGVVKVRNQDYYEVQIDLATGDVLQHAQRRSDIIETIHDGSWFHDAAKLWLFLPAAIILLGLWVSGIYLWILPISAKRAGRKRRAAAASP